jgi:hypothetical protein
MNHSGAKSINPRWHSCALNARTLTSAKHRFVDLFTCQVYRRVARAADNRYLAASLGGWLKFLPDRLNEELPQRNAGQSGFAFRLREQFIR